MGTRITRSATASASRSWALSLDPIDSADLAWQRGHDPPQAQRPASRRSSAPLAGMERRMTSGALRDARCVGNERDCLVGLNVWPIASSPRWPLGT
jgi:hypothetical protein